MTSQPFAEQIRFLKKIWQAPLASNRGAKERGFLQQPLPPGGLVVNVASLAYLSLLPLLSPCFYLDHGLCFVVNGLDAALLPSLDVFVVDSPAHSYVTCEQYCSPRFRPCSLRDGVPTLLQQARVPRESRVWDES